MSGRMLTATEVLGAQQERPGPDQIIAGRIADRLTDAFEEGRDHMVVKGGWLGRLATTHDSHVYGLAADQLIEDEKGLEVEVHRFRIPRLFGRTTEQDVVAVVAVDDELIKPGHLLGKDPNHVGQVWPPDEQELAGMHNMSLQAVFPAEAPARAAGSRRFRDEVFDMFLGAGH